MLELATSPLHADYSPTELSPDEENNSLDWRQILREGESSPEPLGSESELSEWSDEDEAGAGPGGGATALDTSQEEDEASGRAAEAGDPGSWLAARLQPPYWEPGCHFTRERGTRFPDWLQISQTFLKKIRNF